MMVCGVVVVVLVPHRYLRGADREQESGRQPADGDRPQRQVGKHPIASALRYDTD